MNAFAPLTAAAVVIVAAVRFRPRRHRIDAPVATSSPQRGAARLQSWRQRRLARRPPSARAVAEWCDHLARRVRSGSTLRDALGVIVTDDPTVARALTPLALSIDRGAAVAEAAQRVDAPGEHLALALSVVATVSRVGGPSSAALDRTAMALRRRAAAAEDRATHAAQARLSTHVMTALPLLMLAVLTATDGEVRSVVTSPLGAGCVSAGLLLNLTGWWWMRRIVGAGQ